VSAETAEAIRADHRCAQSPIRKAAEDIQFSAARLEIVAHITLTNAGGTPPA
jgi:hypothetical protein